MSPTSYQTAPSRGAHYRPRKKTVKLMTTFPRPEPYSPRFAHAMIVDPGTVCICVSCYYSAPRAKHSYRHVPDQTTASSLSFATLRPGNISCCHPQRFHSYHPAVCGNSHAAVSRTGCLAGRTGRQQLQMESDRGCAGPAADFCTGNRTLSQAALDERIGLRLASKAQPDEHHQPDAPAKSSRGTERRKSNVSTALLSFGPLSHASTGRQLQRCQRSGPRNGRARYRNDSTAPGARPTRAEARVAGSYQAVESQTQKLAGCSGRHLPKRTGHEAQQTHFHFSAISITSARCIAPDRLYG